MEEYILKKEDFFGMQIKIPAIAEEHIQKLLDCYDAKSPVLDPIYSELPEVPEGCEVIPEYFAKEKKIKGWEMIDTKTQKSIRKRILKNIGKDDSYDAVETFFENGEKQKTMEFSKNTYSDRVEIKEFSQGKKIKEIMFNKGIIDNYREGKFYYDRNRIGLYENQPSLSYSGKQEYKLLLHPIEKYINAIEISIKNYRVCVLYDKSKKPYCIFIREIVPYERLHEREQSRFAKGMIVEVVSKKGVNELNPTLTHFHDELSDFIDNYMNPGLYSPIHWYDKSEEIKKYILYTENQIKLITGQSYTFSKRPTSEKEEKELLEASEEERRRNNVIELKRILIRIHGNSIVLKEIEENLKRKGLRLEDNTNIDIIIEFFRKPIVKQPLENVVYTNTKKPIEPGQIFMKCKEGIHYYSCSFVITCLLTDSTKLCEGEEHEIEFQIYKNESSV